MKFAVLPIALICLHTTVASAQTPNDWSLVIQQQGKQFSIQSPIKLKKAPFEFVFQGPNEMAYGILASSQCEELVALKTEAQIAAAIRPTNIGAESNARNDRFLVVNVAGEVQSGDNTAHVWREDKDNQQYSFQRYVPTPKSGASATREVTTFMFQTSDMMAMKQYPEPRLCVLVTGLPPVGHMAHVNPKLVQIVFK
ncbi:hypothetical protein [Massilia sp. TSP1-1-2]|uniref:hypothetical protein n=1 Tax=Massilia sp. TSP1-1-2 TaxID=2804649 RepID=UPI003CEFEDF7